MTTKNTENTDALVAAAEKAVSAFEALKAGTAWANKHATAREAVEALSRAAVDELFPRLPQPVGADLTADLDTYSAGFPWLGFSRALATVHRECIDTHPELAAVIRGPAGRRKIETAAINTATVLDVTEAAAIEGAQQEFQTAAARHLHERGQLVPASRILAVDLPALQSRLDTAKSKHEAAAAAELARVEAEQRRADSAIANERDDAQRKADADAAEAERAAAASRRHAETMRARELADALERRGGRTIRLTSGGAPYSTATLIAGLRRGDIGVDGMAEIEQALKRVAA